VSSCYHERRFWPIRELRRSSIIQRYVKLMSLMEIIEGDWMELLFMQSIIPAHLERTRLAFLGKIAFNIKTIFNILGKRTKLAPVSIA